MQEEKNKVCLFIYLFILMNGILVSKETWESLNLTLGSQCKLHIFWMTTK